MSQFILIGIVGKYVVVAGV